MTFYDIYDETEELAARIMATTEPVSADNVGLDCRCGTLRIGDGFVASTSPRMLDYYGGFEYIEEGVLTIGNMKVYSVYDSTRVQDVLDAFEAFTKE